MILYGHQQNDYTDAYNETDNLIASFIKYYIKPRAQQLIR